MRPITDRRPVRHAKWDYRAILGFILHLTGFTFTTLLIVWGLFVLFFVAIGGFSFDGMMHQLNNLARRYVAADLARIDSFKITILAAHTLFFAGVAFFRRHLLFPARPVRSLDHG